MACAPDACPCLSPLPTDTIDYVLLAGPRVIAYQALLSLVLLRLHPRPVAHTPSYDFTVSFMGVAFGMNAAVARCHARFLTPHVQLAALWAHGPLWLARRVVAGALGQLPLQC